MWIKCSSLLPKEGMLIILRDHNGYYLGGLVELQFGKLGLDVAHGEYFHDFFNEDEWKEIEKD